MKTKSIIVLLTVLTLLIVSCSKNDDAKEQEKPNQIALTKTEYKACFSDNPIDSNKNLLTETGDSLYYTIANDTLLLHLIVNYNCCGLLNDSIVYDEEDVNIYIRDRCIENCLCYCMCDFEYEYSFVNFLGNNPHFYVYLEGYEEGAYTLWGDLEYGE